MDRNIKIVSLNENGLNIPVKRKKVTSILQIRKAQIVYLQKTHLSGQEHEKVEGVWFCKIIL